jgi:hypothetical protein
MAKKYKKQHSTSLAIKEIQIKTALRFHLTPVRLAMIKKTSQGLVVHNLTPSYLGG